ncbi:MAG: DUF1553 domain-containing protein [Bacteroidota bacterium]
MISRFANRNTVLFISCCLLVVWFFSTSGSPVPEQLTEAYNALPDEIEYNLHVKPILSDRCFACHGNDKNKIAAGLRLDNPTDAYAALQTDPGKVGIKPGSLSGSEVYHRIVSEDPDLIMPSKESNLTLSSREKAILIKWIEQGAEYQSHWAFTAPEVDIQPPTVGDKAWQFNPIDAFVYNRLKQEGLSPSEEASRTILLRRLSFDITGLPPTPEEVEVFLTDTEPGAYERQVDRLLASLHYGERMAVDWLDLARFADTHGYLADRYRDMSPWRDWVIEAFNKNQSYDEFVSWQLAGDLMPNPTRDQMIATGFNRLHPQNAEDGIIDEEFRVAYVSDRTDVLGKGLMGLSVACAKCHDHKYDPISQKNYYELYSFFNNINESGLISWEGATPTPALLLPTEAQSHQLDSLQEIACRLEMNIESMLAVDTEELQDYLDDLPHRRSLLNTSNIQPIAHFPLDDVGMGNRLNPSQRAKMDRQFSDSEHPLLVDGWRGQALKFDGDAWLDLQDVGVFSRSQPFTVAFQVYVPDSLQEGYLVHKGYGTGLHAYRGFHLKLVNDRLELMMAHTYPDNAINEYTTNSFPRSQWVHVAITYDGSSTAEGLRVYLDGVEQETVIEIDNLYKDIIFHNLVDVIYPEPIEPGIQFGGRWRGAGLREGMIDEIYIFKKELSALDLLHRAKPQEAVSWVERPLAELSLDQQNLLYAQSLRNESATYSALKNALDEARSVYVSEAEAVSEIMVMREMPQRRPAYILERGQYDVYGEEVFSATPASVMPMSDSLPRNRLGLARWLFHPDHPLTARVAVNRYWQLFFNRGLVKSVEDFGNQGDFPDHPELLDWLAVDFMRSDWDVKKLVKQIVMSRTYRQSSRTSGELLEQDVENVLLARGPARRLTGEMIRDNALAASGLLNDRIGGESVKPYQPEGLWKINNMVYDPDSGDSLYRRSLYTFWKRSVPNPTLAVFDVPDRSECTVRRQNTNTPLQALTLMNDPTFLEAARIIGLQISREEHLETGVRRAYLSLSGREPTPEELAALMNIQAYEHQKFRDRIDKPNGLLSIGQTPIYVTAEHEDLYANTVLASVIMCSEAVTILR